MEEQEVVSQTIIDKAKEYVNVRTELSVLNAVDKGSKVIAGMVTNGLVLLLCFLTILFGSLALGFYLSEVFGNTYAGFLIIAGFYLLAALILNSIKEKYIEKRLINAVIEKFFRVRNEDKDENKDSKY